MGLYIKWNLICMHNQPCWPHCNWQSEWREGGYHMGLPFYTFQSADRYEIPTLGKCHTSCPFLPSPIHIWYFHTLDINFLFFFSNKTNFLYGSKTVVMVQITESESQLPKQMLFWYEIYSWDLTRALALTTLTLSWAARSRMAMRFFEETLWAISAA